MDFTDPGSLVEAMDGVACVFLLLPFGEPMTEWAGNAVQAARKAGVEHIVRLSGFGADPASDCLLNRIQGGMDAMVETSGRGWTLLRPNAFMQNFPVYYGDMIRRHGALYLPDGDGRTSFVDARDVAAVAAEVLLDLKSYERRALEITGPQAFSGTEVANLLSTAAARAITYQPIDESTAREGMHGMPAWNIEVLLSMSAFVRNGGAAAVRETIEKITGREPRTFDRFAHDHADSWTQRSVPSPIGRGTG